MKYTVRVTRSSIDNQVKVLEMELEDQQGAALLLSAILSLRSRFDSEFDILDKNVTDTEIYVETTNGIYHAFPTHSVN